MTDRRYAGPVAFRRALDDRLKSTAKARGVPVNTLRRQFVLECYLARVFSLPENGWLLKGGAGLVARLPGARHSRDLDLCQTVSERDLQGSIGELVTAGRPGERDPFVFDVVRRTEINGNAEGSRLTVTARVGGTVYEQFPIDMTVRSTFTGQVEIVQKHLPVQIDDVEDPPAMRLYPMADQVADKVAAMYETHGSNPSGRYRDLVDLVLITTHSQIILDEVVAALRLQEIIRRIVLPRQLVSPGPAWTAGYRKAATDARLDITLRSLDRAIRQVSHHLDPALVSVAALRDRL